MSGAPGEGLAIAEELTGPLIAKYRSLAASCGLWISIAGFQEKSPTPGKVYNTHVMLDDAGDVRAVYRKIHLFDLDHPDVKLKESETVTAGEDIVVVDTPAGRVGLTTCYDVRFPALYAALVRAGAEVLAIPSAFTVPTGVAHWEVLLRARAIESQCYVVAAAQAGKHNEKRTTYGHAMVVDPWGAVIAQCSDGMAGATADAVVATIDHAYTAAVRARMPVAGHVRPDVYARPVGTPLS